MRNETLSFLIAAFAILVIASVLALGVLYPNGLGGGRGKSYISVSATGSAYGTPQLATLYVIMNGSGATTAIASSNLSLTLSEFNNSISKYVSGNLSKVTTQSYTLLRYNQTYVATEMVSVALPDMSNVSPAIGDLSQIKNVYISRVSSRLTGQQEATLRKQALQSAMLNASEQAAALAPNKTLTILNITAAQPYIYPNVAFASGAAYQNPLFYTGTETLTQSVYVIYSYG